MSDPISSRREFLVAAGAVVAGGLLADDTVAFGRRCRHWNQELCPPCQSPPQHVRPDIAKMPVPRLEAFQNGVAAMKARPASDPRSWSFQANIHGMVGP